MTHAPNCQQQSRKKLDRIVRKQEMEICPTQIVAGFLKGQKKLHEGKLKKIFALPGRAKMLGDREPEGANSEPQKESSVFCSEEGRGA